jgi:hypothetical protein
MPPDNYRVNPDNHGFLDDLETALPGHFRLTRADRAWCHRTMRKILLSLCASLLISPALHAAPPLAPGQIVVAGFAYFGLPPGACADRLCTVDPALTTLTPISSPLPADSRVLDLAIENPSSIVVLVSVPDVSRPSTGTLFHVDVATGAVTTLASGLRSPATRASRRARAGASS